MGAVYKATDTRLDRTVAIKTIQGRFSERFERESKTIASLNHPNICTLHDVGPNYLVMEYIERRPLEGSLPLPEVIRLGSQIAEALDAAHRMITKSDPVILGETATLVNYHFRRDDAGTLQYMSPELILVNGTELRLEHLPKTLPRSTPKKPGALSFE